jgi:hypothetical protein
MFGDMPANLPEDEAVRGLADLCAPYAKVLQARVVSDRLTGRRTGLANVVVQGRPAAETLAAAAQGGELRLAGQTLTLVIMSGPYR